MSRSRVEELMERAAAMEHTPTQVALLEEAVREADTLGDARLAYRARMRLVSAATFSGAPDKALVAFSWCRSQFDAHPDEYDVLELLWDFKWIIGQLTDFAGITRQQISEVEDDLQRRLESLGYNIRPVHKLRWGNFMDMGEREKTLEHLEKWKAAPRDRLDDCQACEANQLVKLSVFLNNDREAAQRAGHIIDGTKRCAAVPHVTYAHALPALLRLKRIEQAEQYHRRGYPMIRSNIQFLLNVADHVTYLACCGNLRKGVNLLERHLPWTVSHTNDTARFRFYLASARLLETLAAAGRRKSRKLRLPAALPCHAEDDLYAPGELAEWFDQQAGDLAERFNRRNGNDYFTQLIEESRALAGMRAS